jgi:hypothetical protein
VAGVGGPAGLDREGRISFVKNLKIEDAARRVAEEKVRLVAISSDLIHSCVS